MTFSNVARRKSDADRVNMDARLLAAGTNLDAPPFSRSHTTDMNIQPFITSESLGNEPFDQRGGNGSRYPRCDPLCAEVANYFYADLQCTKIKVLLKREKKEFHFCIRQTCISVWPLMSDSTCPKLH